MIRQSKSISLNQYNQPVPFVEKKKLGADHYVNQRLQRIRRDRSRQVSTSQHQFQNKTKQLAKDDDRQGRRAKKSFIVASSKIISSEKAISAFEPLKRQIEELRKKSTATIDYEELLSNLHPFTSATNATNDQGKADKDRRAAVPALQSPGSYKLYRSIPKKRQSKQAHKPFSDAKNQYEQAVFLSVGKMSLLQSEYRNKKKASSENPQVEFLQKRVSSLSFSEAESSKPEQIFFRPKFQNSRPKAKGLEQIDERSEMKLPRIIDKDDYAEQQKTYNEELGQEQLRIEQNLTKRKEELSPPKRRKKLINIPFETYYYRLMVWKVNFSNSRWVETPNQYEHRVKVYIGKGNNSGLVRALVKRRTWIAITDKIEEANFVWTQLKSLPYFRLQDTSPLFKTAVSHAQAELEYRPRYLTSSDENLLNQYIHNYCQVEERADERLLFRSKMFNSHFTQTVRASDVRQCKVQNHLINNYVIGNKKALFQTMSAYYAQRGEEVFNYLPLTFHVKQGLEDPVYFKFLKYYYQRAKEIKAQNSKLRNIWIVKPGENSNRGNGINVCLTLEQIKAILKKKQVYADGSYRTYIVQSYIEKPLLYNKRKFDLRHYMMITCSNGIMKGYWYREGYVRTTSTEYSLGTNSSKVHLTNDAVQKNLPDYGKFEKGNKLSYDELEEYMLRVSGRKGEPVSFYKHILPQMKKVAADAIRACSGTIDPDMRQDNFQIFGMDFMIDSDFRLYLIQINSNPCLELSCPLLGSLIPRMVENSLEITLDTHFPPPVRYCPKGVHYFKNLDQENRYELVYDSRLEAPYNCSLDVLDNKLLEEEDDVFEDDGEQFDPED